MATTNFPRPQIYSGAMEALHRNLEKQQQGDAADGKDDFKYEEESPKDERSPTQEEKESVSPSVVDFFLNFLFQNGMTETLLCFQAEWYELVQKGLVAAGRDGVVPDVYVENQRLDAELRNALREREARRRAASAGAETLEWVQRARDLHRMQHKQDLQEMKRLNEGIKRLKTQCDTFGNKIKTMKEKYLSAVKQVRLALDRDKVFLKESSCFKGQEGEDSQDSETETQKENERKCSLK